MEEIIEGPSGKLSRSDSAYCSIKVKVLLEGNAETWGARMSLLRLGTKELDAILNGVSSRGPWRMPRTPVVNDALSNKWLADQGLLSLAKMWANIHHPTTVR